MRVPDDISMNMTNVLYVVSFTVSDERKKVFNVPKSFTITGHGDIDVVGVVGCIFSKCRRGSAGE